MINPLLFQSLVASQARLMTHFSAAKPLFESLPQVRFVKPMRDTVQFGCGKCGCNGTSACSCGGC